MREKLLEILSQARSAWRFKWTAMWVAWGVAFIGWTIVAMLPNRYASSAKIYVDSESVLKPLLQGLAVNTDVMNQVNMMSRVLMSRPNLEKVAQETDLALRTPTPEGFERMIQTLPTRIGLNGGAGNIFAVTFEDHDPQMAYRVVKTLVDAFVESAIGVKREDASGAQRFLNKEIQDYELKLREAEDRLAEFKKNNIGLMPGETGDYYQRRQVATEALEKLRSELRIAEQRRDELQRQIQGEEPTFGLFTGGPTKGGPAAVPVDPKIAEYQRQLDQLLLEYTPQHPRVIALQETIDQLKKQKGPTQTVAPAVEADPTRLAARALDINPVYQNMKINLSQSELQVVELRNKINQQQLVVSDLQSKVNTIPEVEAQLSRLNRDYEVNRTQYQSFLQRSEQARVSERAEDSREQIKFRIIEPAAVPLVPIGPNRPLFATVVLVLAIAAGGAVALLRSMLKPVFMDRNSLANISQIPVLGTITFAPVMAGAKRSDSRVWVIGMGGLGILFLVVVATASRFALLMAGT